MRLWTFSDLHQDHADNVWDPTKHTPSGGFDVVVASGDVGSPLTSAIGWLADRFPGVRVVYVPGNHDYWSPRHGDGRFTHVDMLARGRDLAAPRGVDLLSDDTVVIDGVRFVGSTLWTDLRYGAWSRGHATATARRQMVDYKTIRRRVSGPHRHIRTDDTIAMHRASVAYIDDVLARPIAGRSVVVSHHAPHPRSLPGPSFDLAWAYASDLTSLIRARGPDLWVHGHLHGSLDYVVENTRIVANARGHVEEAMDFDPSFVIDL